MATPMNSLVLEGLVVTLDDNGRTHVAPMGPIVEPDMRRLVLRPFPESNTWRNLKRTGEGVFHITDNVEMLARAAVGRLEEEPATLPAPGVTGRFLVDCCRWYAFRTTHVDESQERVRIEADVVEWGVQREFFGFNRARHAVVEAAILATRTRFLPAAEVLAEFERLAAPVAKTGGEVEQRAFDFLRRHATQAYAAANDDAPR